MNESVFSNLLFLSIDLDRYMLRQIPEPLGPKVSPLTHNGFYVNKKYPFCALITEILRFIIIGELNTSLTDAM